MLIERTHAARSVSLSLTLCAMLSLAGCGGGGGGSDSASASATTPSTTSPTTTTPPPAASHQPTPAQPAPSPAPVTQPTIQAATLTWVAPSENTDGTALVDLAGFRIVYGNSPDALTQVVQIDNPSISTYVLDNLPAGTHYFAVRAYTATGVESANSQIASKVIG